MGACESDQSEPVEQQAPKQPLIDGQQFLNELPDGWVTASGKQSLSMIRRPGRIWGMWTDWPPRNLPTYYCHIRKDLSNDRKKPCESWFPTDGSYGSNDVKQGRVEALGNAYGARERIDNPSFHCHDMVSAMAGKTYFYDFDFNIVDRDERIEQTFHLEAKREICGFVFMEAPLKYVPIGKNYIEAEGPNKPYMMFAVPKHVVMSVRVDGSMVEYANSPCPGKKCFLCWELSDNKEMDQCRYFNVFILARKKKASNWSGGVEYPRRCVEAFAKLFSSLKPGQHTVEMWFQFAYDMENVGLVTNEALQTIADHGNAVYGGGPDVQRLVLNNMRVHESESLILKPDYPQKMLMSEIFSMGTFGVTVPEKDVFDEVMKPFHGFEDAPA